jgi:murein DD-endopeptidase MepM/ murein hydrolase activator NlpD
VKKYRAELILIIVSLLFIIGFKFKAKIELPSYYSRTIIEEVKPVRLVWGMPFDSISIDTFSVRRNQSLSDILSPYGVSASSIDQIARNSKGVFDVRKIKSGNPYYIISRDTLHKKPDILLYEESAISYILYDLDSLTIDRGQKKVDTLLNATGGIIETSLWNSFVKNGSSPALALDLSDIFAWTIDFFGIQRGDEFKVIYDELFVEGKFIGVGHIHAAMFVHMNDTINAYFYKNENQYGYFDDEGLSLRKAFLKAPLRFSRISSRFSNSRMHPVLKIRRPHHGIDYAAPLGTPVYSIGDGTVVKKAYQKRGGGNYINIKHNSVYTSQYMHLNGYANGIATGVRIKQGQLIGYVGKSGLATGPHLDFRIYKNGAAIDPLKVKAPPVEPINESNLFSFSILRDSLKQKIDAIQFTTNQELTSEQ